MNILNIFSEISGLLIVIPPTVFVFGVTLLGTAIDKARSEEKSARENEKATINEKIKTLEEQVNQLKKDGDTSTIIVQLEQLKKEKKITDKKIALIREKYKRINLSNTVLQPTVSLLTIITLNKIYIGSMLVEQLPYNIVITLAEMIVLLFALYKIYQSLNIIEEISSSKRESTHFDQLKETIKVAISEYYQSTREEISFEFVNKKFPLNVNTETELNVRFRVKLLNGTVVQNVRVWFFIPDGFELIKPTEADSWKQSSDYSFPNIRTVEINIGKLSIGPHTPGTLIIKTPADKGKYIIRYKVLGDGYNGSNQDITLLVE